MKQKPFNNAFEAVAKTLKAQQKKAERAAKDDRPEKLSEKAKQKPNTGSRRDLTSRDNDRSRRDAPEATEATEDRSFADLMRDADRLNADPRGHLRPSLPPQTAEHIPIYDEDTEVYETLLDLVDGHEQFDISDSDEFIEGCVEGLDRRILGKLRRGAFSFRAHLDLHGLHRDKARSAVETFLREKQEEGHRCVLIIHGRGLNSKDSVPILKSLLRTWLEQGRIARRVLAFATARPGDGGAGAIYVLLRRPRPSAGPGSPGGPRGGPSRAAT